MSDQVSSIDAIAREVAALVKLRRGQYGNAIRALDGVLKELYPAGIRPDQYYEFMIISRILEKICRLTRGDGTGRTDAWTDIVGHGLIGAENDREASRDGETQAEV